MQHNDFNRESVIKRSHDSLLSTHTVLRNTYMLLSMTLLFSAVMAGISMSIGFALPAGFGGLMLLLVGTYGLLFMTHMFANSSLGLLCVFAFTGFMGFTLGPVLTAFMSMANGGQLIMTALGGTGLIFFGLSGYVLTTRKDMSFMGGFLTAGVIVLLICMVMGFFFQSSAFHLMISAGFMLLSSGIILWETSNIIHGGEKNYIIATVTLYVQLYNIFISLLQILSAFNNRD